MKKAIAALAIGLAVGLPACSSSSGADAQFVGKLTSQGIPGDRGVEIAAAHQVCDALRPVADARTKHLPMQDMMPMILKGGQEMKTLREQLTNQQGLSLDQFEHLIAAAGDTYCPDIRAAMNSSENTP
jgi:hypothetical protein